MSLILLDMDGPLAGFDQHFWDRCTAEGWAFDIDGPHQQAHRYFTEHIPHRPHRKAARALVDSSGWFRGLPVVEGAQDGVEALLAAGHTVWVCTKPLEVNPTCRDEKGAWLAEHFPMLNHQLILAPDKSLIRGDVLLDDAPLPRWTAHAEWRPVIFTAPYNGAGTSWAQYPHWTWGDPIERLLYPPTRVGGTVEDRP